MIKTRSLFPNEDAAKKLIWLAIKNSTKQWNKTVLKLRQALLEIQLYSYSLENDYGLNKAAAAKLGFFVPATQSLQSPICSEGIEPIFERI